MMTCTVCLNLDLPRSSPSASASLQINFTRLREASQAGCRSCTAIRDSINAYPGSLGLHRIRSLRLISDSAGSPLIIQPTGPTAVGVDPLYVKSLEIYVQPGEAASWPAIGFGCHVSEDPSSEKALALARGWLSDCASKHHECPSVSAEGPSPLPTRVIDVGSATTNPRLFATEGASGNYAALSYCWGPPPWPWKTTSANVAEKLTGTPLSSLPQTLRDAVSITRSLGLQYLWIDAICIIQEGPSSDWAAEAGKMAAYYGNATVTISADASTSSTAGCFVRGDRRISVPVRVSRAAEKRGDAVVHVRTAPGWALEGAHPPGAQDMPKNRLLTRGWTLQEQVLAPRVLHVHGCELVWECAAAMRCECKAGAEQPSIMLLRNRLVASPYLEPSSRRRQPAPESESGLLLNWTSVVAEFTLRDLTYPSDRLPAVAGLAAAMLRRNPGDEYLAGLWRRDLFRWLCWRVHAPLKSSSDASAAELRSREIRRPQGNRHAPSWSWASVTGTVDAGAQFWTGHGGSAPPGSTVRSLVVVLDVACTPVSADNPLGSVSRGVLRCKGKVASAMLQKLQWDKSLYVEAAQLGVKGDRVTAVVYPDVFGDEAEVEVGRMYSVLMILSRNHQARELEYTYGLLLQVLGNNEHRRVGLVMAGLPVDEFGSEIGLSSITDWEAITQEQEITII